jgi:hypothetical protein
MSYYAHTHKVERIANKSLYRIRGIPFQEMLENLTILLENVDESCSTATLANLPTNSQVMNILSKQKTPSASIPEISYEFMQVNEMCVVAWQEGNGYQWYLGYIKHVNSDGTFSVDHLRRALESSNSKWKYPSNEDIQEVSSEQIIKIKVQGDWDLVADSRKRLFSLDVDNVNAIQCAFDLHVL